jgi:hypothetical protein
LIASGMCFAGCLFIKPAVFPYTLGLVGLCIHFQTRAALRSGITILTLRRYLLEAGIFLSVAILPALTHYILDWHHITGYIGNIALSKDSVWLRHDDLLSGLLFHVTGYPGRIMLGGFLRPAILCITAGMIVRLLRPRSWPDDLPLLALIYFTLGAYAGVAVNPMNQNYFGMTFHWMLLITALVALSGIVTVVFPRHLTASSVVTGGIALIAFFGFKFPLSIDFYREKAGGDPTVFTWLQKSPELVMEPIRHESAKSGATKVWITAYTMINARTLEWYSLLGREPFIYKDFIESDWKVVPTSLEWADYVIVPEPGTPSLETIIPNAAMSERMINQLNHDPSFQLLKIIPSPHSGPGFRIYAKQRPPVSQ